MNKARVLIVEDEAIYRFSLSNELARAGYEICEAVNGMEALRLITERTSYYAPFDLMLLDINMPIMNGIDLLFELRKLNIFIPFLIISSYSSNHIQLSLLDSCYLGSIKKPCNESKIVSEVNRCLGTYSRFQPINLLNT